MNVTDEISYLAYEVKELLIRRYIECSRGHKSPNHSKNVCEHCYTGLTEVTNESDKKQKKLEATILGTIMLTEEKFKSS